MEYPLRGTSSHGMLLLIAMKGKIKLEETTFYSFSPARCQDRINVIFYFLIAISVDRRSKCLVMRLELWKCAASVAALPVYVKTEW